MAASSSSNSFFMLRLVLVNGTLKLVMKDMQPSPIIQVLSRYSQNFHPVVSFDPAVDRLHKMDFTATNTTLTTAITEDSQRFTDYIQKQIDDSGSRYGIGGYDEHRTIYAWSAHFDGA